jgi:hypothetical protein
MRRAMKQAREATEGRAVSNSSTRLVVQRYWRKLADPEALPDHGPSPKNVSNFKVHQTDRPMETITTTREF